MKITGAATEVLRNSGQPRHDRAKELGAFANPKGRPRRKNSATGNLT